MSSMACPTLQYSFALFHKPERFEKKENITEHKARVVIFSTTFVWNISHPKKKWARYDRKCLMVFMQVSIIIVQF